MSDTGHTPGPLTVKRATTPSDGGYDYAIIADGMCIAECFGVVGDGVRVNARDKAELFASAPETSAERDRLKEVNAELLDFIEGLQHHQCIKFGAYACGQHGLLDKHRPGWRTNAKGEAQ